MSTLRNNIHAVTTILGCILTAIYLLPWVWFYISTSEIVRNLMVNFVILGIMVLSMVHALYTIYRDYQTRPTKK